MPRLRADRGRVLRARARPHARRHVRRPALRRQPGLHRLGAHRLPGPAPRRDGRAAAHGCASSSRCDARPTTMRSSTSTRPRASAMATRLDPTDVVVVGLGGAGGVAVEPLAAAGLNVVGLEAGTWLSRARLRARRAAQQLSRLAARRRRSAIARFPSTGRTLRRPTPACARSIR